MKTQLCTFEWRKEVWHMVVETKGSTFWGEHFKMHLIFQWKFSYLDRNSFLCVILTKGQHCVREGHGSEQATEHYMNEWWSSILTHICVTWSQYIMWPLVCVHAWWRHQMETFSALLALCAGNSPVPGEFPTQRPVTRGFDVYFDLRPNKRLSKQSLGWWFMTLSCPLWRHRNGTNQLPRNRIHMMFGAANPREYNFT